ncbi:PorT family protein [Vicingaceae bacterium]|nr:PorT family protein [Vicingaceae bacterium]
MKKISLTIFAIVLAFATSYGQHFDIRAYGGFNVLQLTSDQGVSLIDGVLHDQKVSGRPGAQFGAALTFGSRFFVQPGFQYSILTSEIINESTVTDDVLKEETTINAFSVPLKVGFRLIDPEKENLFNVRIFGGFDGSHILSVDHSKGSEKIDDIDEDDFTNLIVSADFGMGIDIFIFYVDLGYQLGLTPVYTGGDQAKANAFYSNIGLRLSF